MIMKWLIRIIIFFFYKHVKHLLLLSSECCVKLDQTFYNIFKNNYVKYNNINAHRNGEKQNQL